jgi:hypothetical protein
MNSVLPISVFVPYHLKKKTYRLNNVHYEIESIPDGQSSGKENTWHEPPPSSKEPIIRKNKRVKDREPFKS